LHCIELPGIDPARGRDGQALCLPIFQFAIYKKAKTMQTFNETLRDLLNRLDAVAAMYPEITDTDVRDHMSQAILQAFLHLDENYCYTPRSFAMFSDDGNTKVMAVLYAFISEAVEAAKREGFDTFHKRFAAFQNRSIVSDEGHNFDYYFGHWNTEDFDENGKRVGNR